MMSKRFTEQDLISVPAEQFFKDHNLDMDILHEIQQDLFILNLNGVTCHVAGGLFRRLLDGSWSNDAADIDYFVNGKLNIEEIFPDYKVMEEDFARRTCYTDTAFEVIDTKAGKYKKQFISCNGNMYTTPFALFRDFDFTINCICYDGTNIIFHPQALDHIMRKRLVRNWYCWQYPSAERIKKFKDLGYKNWLFFLNSVTLTIARKG